MDKKIEVNQETLADVSGGVGLPAENMVKSDGPLGGREWFFCLKCTHRLEYVMHSDVLGTLYRCRHCHTYFWYYNGEWTQQEGEY